MVPSKSPPAKTAVCSGFSASSSLRATALIPASANAATPPYANIPTADKGILPHKEAKSLLRTEAHPPNSGHATEPPKNLVTVR